MNKAMKKFLILVMCLFTSAFAVTSLCLMGGCTNQQSGGNSSQQSSQSQTEEPEITEASIEFSITEKSMLVGDEEYVLPTYEKLKGFSLSYLSSDTSVVAVDNGGKISAQGEGSAVVKAIYSNGKVSADASFTVHCSFGGYLPELKTMGVASDISVALNDSYKVLPYVMFNGKTFDDAIVSYTIVDSEVAEINEDGLIAAKANGKTQLLVEASWRGMDKSNTLTLQKVINLSVINDVRFYNDGQSISDEELYTFAEFDGKSYKNSLPCKFKVQVNGVEETASYIIEDESVITRQGDTLVVRSYGSTNVLLQKTVGEETYSKTFTVTVKRVEKAITQKVPLFGTVDGNYFDAERGAKRNLLSFINETNQAVDAYQDERELKIENGKIFGVESSSLTQRGEAEISVGTANVLYHFTLETLAKVMTSKEDVKSLELSVGKSLSGYYEMINDIDASGISLNHVVSDQESFAGVFNGNGYNIKNLTLKANSSLFGVLNSPSATIKNLGLINLNATKAYFLAHNTLGDGLNISNVYIGLSPSTVTPRGLTARTAQNSIWKNIVIEYLGGNAQANRNYQERYTWQGLIGGLWTYEDTSKSMLFAQDKNWKDVYVISPFVVSFRCDEKKDGSQYAALYGYGANEKNDIYGNPLTAITYHRDNPNLGEYWQTTMYYDAVFTNLYHYNSYDALVAEKRDFSSFSSDYWVVFENKIIWKSEFTEDLEVRFFEGANDLGTDAKIVGLNKELSVKSFAYGKELKDIDVSISENDYIIWDVNKKVMRLVSAPVEGAVSVPVTITVNVGDAEIVKHVDVMAIASLVNVEKTYDLIDADTGKMAGNAFPMSEIVGSETVLSVYQGSTRITYNAQQGTLQGLTANITGSGENREVQPVELTINTEGKVYLVNVKVYSKVITTAKELQYFNQTLPENASNSYAGYYILAKNIVDYSTVYNDAPDKNSGLKTFTGTFDGNGHSISLKVNKGVFGVLGNGAVIKNLAFTNMQVMVSDSYTMTAIVAESIANATDVAVVKDVYISLDQANNPYRQYLSMWFTTAMLVGNNASIKSKFENIVIEADIFHSDYNAKGGAQPCLFRYWNGIDEAARGGEYAKDTVADSLTNVYVISKDRTNKGGLFRVTSGINRATNKSMALCYNDFFMVANGQDAYTTLYLPDTYTSGTKKIATMRRYDTYTAMASAGNDYSLFNSNCWNITGGTPVWKNK